MVWKRDKLPIKKPNKGSKKAWEKFTQWLRTKSIETVEYFQSDCESKWLINNENERLHVKGNESVHKVDAKLNENNRQSIY